MRNEGQARLDRRLSAAHAREACIAAGHPPITPAQIRDLALSLYTVIFQSGDVIEPQPVRDCCIRRCQQRGLDQTMATMISEALTGYVYGWNSRGAHLVPHMPKAQAILNCAMGGYDDTVRHTLAVGARLTPYAIADMIGWVLTAAPTSGSEETSLCVSSARVTPVWRSPPGA